MNPIAVAIACWVMIGVELGLRRALEFGSTGISPYLLLPLIVHIAMHAPHLASYWTALLTGLVVDLQSPRPTSDGLGDVVIIGPNALGFLMAAAFTLNVRTIVIRRNPLSFVAVSIAAAGIAQITAVMILTMRGSLDSAVAFNPGEQLWIRLVSSAATGITALALAYPLRWSNPVLGLSDPSARRFTRREA